MLKRNRRIRT